MDGKATVHMGAFSRGGLTRGDPRASAHAMGCQEPSVPCGMGEEARGAWHLTCGSSDTTSDGIVATLAATWEAMAEQEQAETSLLQTDFPPSSIREGIDWQ